MGPLRSDRNLDEVDGQIYYPHESPPYWSGIVVREGDSSTVVQTKSESVRFCFDRISITASESGVLINGRRSSSLLDYQVKYAL